MPKKFTQSYVPHIIFHIKRLPSHFHGMMRGIDRIGLEVAPHKTEVTFFYKRASRKPPTEVQVGAVPLDASR